MCRKTEQGWLYRPRHVYSACCGAAGQSDLSRDSRPTRIGPSSIAHPAECETSPGLQHIACTFTDETFSTAGQQQHSASKHLAAAIPEVFLQWTVGCTRPNHSDLWRNRSDTQIQNVIVVTMCRQLRQL